MWSPPARAGGADAPIGSADTPNLGWLSPSSSPAAKALDVMQPLSAKALDVMQPLSAKALAWGGAAVPDSGMDARLEDALDALYGDVVALGDRARGWFDGPGIAWRAQLPLADQTAVATESLAITARLMAVMAWLLDPAQDHGRAAPLRRLVIDPAADGPMPAVLHGQQGGEIARASRDLVARAETLAMTRMGQA